MEDPKSILKTLKIIAICSVIFILVIVIYHLIINSHRIEKVEKERIDYSLTEVNTNYDNPKYCNNFYVVNDKLNKTAIILNEDLQTIENLSIPVEDVYCLYDDYYLIKNNSNNVTLKKNGSIIDTIDLNVIDSGKIYNDVGGMYLTYEYIMNTLNNEKTLLLNKYAYADNVLIDIYTGTIIDNNIINLKEIYYKEEIRFLYITTSSNNTYLFDITSGSKLYPNYYLVFPSLDEKYYTQSINSFVFQKNDRKGLIDKLGNVIIEPNEDNIILNSDNDYYYAVVRNNKYGLINSFSNVALDFVYDNIIVLDNYVITVKDSKLDVYNNVLEKINTEEYACPDASIIVNDYPDFIQIKSIDNNGLKELIITKKDNNFHLINAINIIKYGELFYNDTCYLVNDEGNYSIYIKDEKKFKIMTNFKNNIDNTYMLNFNELYLDYKYEEKIKYSFYRINSGKLIEAYSKDELDQEFESYKVKKVVFVRQNDTIKVYFNNDEYDSFTATELSHLHDDYYLLKTSDENKFIHIMQK